jgi:SET domain-containing protein
MLWYLKKSSIHGQGVFSNTFIKKDSLIDSAIVFPFLFEFSITNFGSKINHSYIPNSKLRFDEKSKMYNVYATRDINPDEEILLNYNDTPFFIEKALPHYT